MTTVTVSYEQRAALASKLGITDPMSLTPAVTASTASGTHATLWSR